MFPRSKHQSKVLEYAFLGEQIGFNPNISKRVSPCLSKICSQNTKTAYYSALV